MGGILARYVAATWLRLLLLCQGSLVSVYLVLDMVDKIPRFIKAGGAAVDIVRFFAYKVPEMVGQTAAFSILMATLLTLGLLSRNSEITAMRSCGISLLSISLPMLFLGLAASGALLVNSEMLIPKSFERMEYVERVAIRKQPVHAFFKRNNIWFRSDAQILQSQLFDPSTKTLKGVVIWTLDASMNPVSRIDADTAELNNGRWMLLKPEVKTFGQGSGYSVSRPASLEVPLNLKIDDLRVLDNNADNFSYLKLHEYADSLQKGGYQAFRYLTMMHAKLSAPFAAFIMVILGIPFALRSTRSGGVALGIGASIGIGFAYFVVNAVLLSYGRSGVLPPAVAAWGANMIFGLGGIWLTLTIKD